MRTNQRVRKMRESRSDRTKNTQSRAQTLARREQRRAKVWSRGQSCG